MNHTVNSAQSLQGFVFCYLGFVMDSSAITAYAGVASVVIGFLMMVRQYQKTAVDMRISVKAELKLDLETRKAELEIHLLEQEILDQNDEDNENNRKNAKRV